MVLGAGVQDAFALFGMHQFELHGERLAVFPMRLERRAQLADALRQQRGKHVARRHGPGFETRQPAEAGRPAQDVTGHADADPADPQQLLGEFDLGAVFGQFGCPRCAIPEPRAMAPQQDRQQRGDGSPYQRQAALAAFRQQQHQPCHRRPCADQQDGKL